MLVDNDPATETPGTGTAQPVPAEATAAPAEAPKPATTTAEPETPAEPKTALEAALMALAPKGPAGDATAAKPAGEVESPDAKAPAVEDPQDESLADVPLLPAEVFGALPKEARTAFNTLRSQVNKLRPAAERGQAVAEYLESAGMTAGEFAELQNVGALMKTDPLKARDVLLEHADRIAERFGLKVPDDIARDAEQGFISDEHARELARTRAEARMAKEMVAAREADASLREVVGAAEAWEARTRATDPDFDLKLPSMRQAVELEVTRRAMAGKPVTSAKEALDIAERAYADTNAMMSRFRPAPARVPPSPSSAAPVPAAPLPEPKTAHEAALRALHMTGRRG